MRKLTGPMAALLALTAGCYGREGRLFAGLAGTAILTAAIVSANEPPPPRVEVVPAPRGGWVWQPGYWTLDEGEWVWIEGRWVQDYRGYYWNAAHWERDPDGYWRLVPGHWVRR